MNGLLASGWAALLSQTRLYNLKLTAEQLKSGQTLFHLLLLKPDWLTANTATFTFSRSL
jgi:hypothetical protein